MRVEVNRQADLVLESLDQGIGRAGTAQSGHVLDPENVGAGRLQLARELQVVVEGVLLFVRIAQVSRVANGSFAQLA